MSIWLDLDSERELDRIFATLGGITRMPVADYGFSPRFAWVDDRFGVSWQLNLAGLTAP